MEECVGTDEANMGNLWLGFVSGAFVVVQTASTVGFGDTCTARVLRTLDPWASILLSVVVLSVFGLYLSLMKYAIEFQAKFAFRYLCVGNNECHRRCDDRCCGGHSATLDARPIRIPTLKQPSITAASNGEDFGGGCSSADSRSESVLDESGRFMRKIVESGTIYADGLHVASDKNDKTAVPMDVELIGSQSLSVEGNRHNLDTAPGRTADDSIDRPSSIFAGNIVQKSLSRARQPSPGQLADEELERKRQNIQHVLRESGTLPVWFFSIFVFLTNLILFTALIWPTRQCFSPPIDDFNTFLYFLVTTVTSVGFGDIIPEPDCFGRIGTILAMTIGTSTIVALLTRILLRLDILTKRVRTSVEKDRFLKSGLYHVTRLASFNQR
jgi:hypothetical protein